MVDDTQSDKKPSEKVFGGVQKVALATMITLGGLGVTGCDARADVQVAPRGATPEQIDHCIELSEKYGKSIQGNVNGTPTEGFFESGPHGANGSGRADYKIVPGSAQDNFLRTCIGQAAQNNTADAVDQARREEAARPQPKPSSYSLHLPDINFSGGHASSAPSHSAQKPAPAGRDPLCDVPTALGGKDCTPHQPKPQAKPQSHVLSAPKPKTSCQEALDAERAKSKAAEQQCHAR